MENGWGIESTCFGTFFRARPTGPFLSYWINCREHGVHGFKIAMSNHDPSAFQAAAREAGFLGFRFGFYLRSGFTHVDLGPKRKWGERFAPRATSFAVETPPARERLAESRTIKGGGVAGIATVGGAGIKVAQEVLSEKQGAVLPLVPYLDTLR